MTKAILTAKVPGCLSYLPMKKVQKTGKKTTSKPAKKLTAKKLQEEMLEEAEVQGAPFAQEGEVLVTKEGLEALQDELKNLKEVRRKEVADRIKEAISYGDLSENAEYEDAKNEQAFVEGRIVELELKIKNAKIIKENANKKTVAEVEVGSTVVIRNLKTGEDETFTIVGSTETDPLGGKISNESPVGSQLLGKRVKDRIEVTIPEGEVSYEVRKIS